MYMTKLFLEAKGKVRLVVVVSVCCTLRLIGFYLAAAAVSGSVVL